MKPESRRALMELISFGMEEISSEQAAPLLARINECTECAGQWVLIHRTIDTLSHVDETDISNQRSQQMWLVCMEHAKHKHHPGQALEEGHLISESTETVASSDSHSEEENDHLSHAERFARHVEELRNPLAFFAPQLGFVVASGAMLCMLRL